MLLARTPRKRPPQGDAREAFAAIRAGRALELELNGARVLALPEGALIVPDTRALVVADLHFEKGSAFARAGQMLPPYDTSLALSRLGALIEAHRPEAVVSLGDAFHDGGGPGRMAPDERGALEAMIARVDWVWVEGNHDGASAQTLGGAGVRELRMGALTLRHEPIGEVGEIAGHLHPCAKVSGRGRCVRRRCFAYDGARMVLPAFGAYAGGLNLCSEPFRRVFPKGADALVLGRDKVMPVRRSRLASD